MSERDLPPVYPGEEPLNDRPKPIGSTRRRLAKSIGVPQRVDGICAGRWAITVDTAQGLARRETRRPRGTMCWPFVDVPLQGAIS